MNIDRVTIIRSKKSGAWVAFGGGKTALGDSSVEALLALLEKHAK
ncbi:MAG: hypothetical protein K0Q60_3489 [Microvirga sp.]|nr:hypothetical protein [Microvirga sp.]